MGKNQGWKDMQRGRHNDGPDGPEAVAGAGDGLVDASFHTSEWHAARIASLQVERLSWEEWKKRAKEEEQKQALAADEEERLMREYRAQLDADRAKKLSKGVNHADLREKLDSKKRKRKHKSKDSKKKKSKKESKEKKDKKAKKKKSSKKHRRTEGEGSDSSSTSSSSSDTDKEPDAKKQDDGPVRLSDFMRH